ncbi:MAG: hypothetical protein HQK91_12755 [Nitrospirae bacterium]|nr:hypothetical protein [Nitrospirota bacterium]
MKKDEVVAFNPADYAYMDNMPFMGFIYEIIRRKDGAKQQFEIYWKDDEKPELKEEAFQFFYPIPMINPDLKWSELPEKQRNIIGKNIITTDNSDEYPAKLITLNMGIAKDRYKDKTYEYPPIKSIISDACIETYEVYKYYPPIVRVYDDPQTIPNIDYPFDVLSSYYGKKNIVMALIDISAPYEFEELTKLLRKELNYWKEKADVKKRKSPRKADYEIEYGKKIAKDDNKKKSSNPIKSDKQAAPPLWKFYLIVYDLKKSNNKYSYENIITVINEKYPDFVRSESKTIKKYYKEADKLINKNGYKKHLLIIQSLNR